jgi:hypothetical protein
MSSSLGAPPASEGLHLAEALTGLSDACASNRRVNRPPRLDPCSRATEGSRTLAPSRTARFVRCAGRKNPRALRASLEA